MFTSQMNWLVAVGVCVLVVWLVRRLANPRKLLLRDAPGRPNTVHPLHVLGIFLLLVFGGSSIAWALQAWSSLGPAECSFVANVSMQLILLAALLIVARLTFRTGLRRGLGLSFRRPIVDTTRGVLAYFAQLPVTMGVLVLTILLFLAFGASKEDLSVHKSLNAARNMQGLWRAMVFASTIVVGPIVEELLFRGLLQSMLRRYTGHAWGAILLASVLFALVHAPYWHTMPALLVLSIVLGYNYERCGRLYPSILIHVLFNAVNIANFVWWSRGA